MANRLRIGLAGGLALLCPLMAEAQSSPFTFTTGDLVVSVEGDGSGTGSYTDNQAAPLTLYQYSLNGTSTATLAGSLMLPQTTTGLNYAISGEYGSSSEGSLQLSGNGQYLTIAGYGVTATTFNTGGTTTYGTTALAQSQSSQVPRVIALISANGSVNTTTALTNVFNENNPRSVYTVNGTSFYVSGQGGGPTGSDNTGGVFYATLGATTATSITGNDAGSSTTSQDTRFVTVYNNTLYVSSDSKSGSINRDFIGTLGTAGTLPTTVANNGGGPTMLTGFGNTGGTGKITIANGDGNGLNTGDSINLSPENYFFANSTTLYVADSGDPKNNSNTSGLGDGGLQKWTLNTATNTWTLDYTLSTGLNLVKNTSSDGSSGLYGLTGKVVGNTVELFATNYTLSDLDPTYLYGITDTLGYTSASQASGESFALLATAPNDTTFKGVAFAPTASSPVPLPAAAWLLVSGLGGFGALAYRRRRV